MESQDRHGVLESRQAAGGEREAESTGRAMVCYGALCMLRVPHPNLKPQSKRWERALCPGSGFGSPGQQKEWVFRDLVYLTYTPTPYLAWLLPRLQEGRLQLPFRICCDNPASLVRGSAPANGRAVGSVATKGPETACGLRNIFYDG